MSETHDALFGGTLSLKQPARRMGYRVNVDALLLAAFAAKGRRARHAFDLGAGVGAVGLSLLHLGAADRISLIELDPVLVRLAVTNIADNGWSACARAEECDVRAMDGHDGEADLVVCNPPYTVPGRGRAPEPRIRTAKYGDLECFVDAARRVAGRRCRVCFVYPAQESVTLLAMLRSAGLEPKRLRYVHATTTNAARVALVEALPAKAGGLSIEPPLIERNGRARSAEVETLLSTPRTRVKE